MGLKWDGEKLAERVRNAQIVGVNKTMGEAVIHAKQNHPWQNRTGILEGSINIASFAAAQQGAVSGQWGSLDVAYAVWLELGTAKTAAFPFLRPAADATYKNLSRHIREAMK